MAEEPDYETLPTSAGHGVHMLAGALVCSYQMRSLRFVLMCCQLHRRQEYQSMQSCSPWTASRSVPLPSSMEFWCFFALARSHPSAIPLMSLDPSRLVCKSSVHHLQLYIPGCRMLFPGYPQRKAYAPYGEESPLS